MTIRTGNPVQLEQTAIQGTGPSVAYFKAHATLTNTYVAGTGAKGTEATAYLHLSSGIIYTMDDSSANEDRIPYLVSTTKVLV